MKYYKKLLTSTINKLGFDIIRIPKIKKLDISKYQKKLCLEFIGPSGVGKTTFYNSVAGNLENLVESERTAKKYISLSGKKNSIDNSLLQFYEAIFHHKNMSVIQRGILLQKKIGYLNFFNKELLLDIEFSKYSENICYINSDGFMHNFGSSILHVVKSGEFSENTVSDFFKNKSVVLCLSPVDRIVSNLKKRSIEKPQALNNWLKIHGENAIVAKIEDSIQQKTKLAEIFQHYGGTVLKLDLSNPQSENKKKLLDFIETQI